jgi:hypothetical protein
MELLGFLVGILIPLLLALWVLRILKKKYGSVKAWCVFFLLFALTVIGFSGGFQMLFNFLQ